MAERRKTQPEEIQAKVTQSDGSVGGKSAGDKVGVNKESRFLKEQLYVSARYADKKDLVAALLHDGRGYTIEEVDNIIAEYLHGKVR